MRRPFMDDPAQIEPLEGQQFLVLRPRAAISSLYREVQDASLARLGAGVPHPHTEHVTLRGFADPESRSALIALLREWAAQQHPITITADAIDSFPAPWQILIVRLARTPSLTSAYASLSATLERTDLRRLEERVLDDWTFHLSVVYGKLIDRSEWEPFARASCRELAHPPTEVISEAELVWYQDGKEHVELLPLGARV